MFDFAQIRQMLFMLPVLIISLSFHEFSHALVANKLGDHTPKLEGRLSLNPMRHIDPLGLVMLLLFRFGWAKPVMVNPRNFRSADERGGMLLTSIAGPLSNMLLSFISVGLLVLLNRHFYRLPYLWRYAETFAILNANLAFLNLIPVPPLDGSKVLFGILPRSLYHWMYTVERYGFIILVLLIYTGTTARIIGPLSSGLIITYLKFFQLFI